MNTFLHNLITLENYKTTSATNRFLELAAVGDKAPIISRKFYSVDYSFPNRVRKNQS